MKNIRKLQIMKILLRKVLKEIKLEIPEVPNINEISKFSIKREEKILKEFIKSKDDLIKELYKDNLSLHSQVENIKTEYKEKEFDLEWNYKKQIKKLGK